MRQAGSYHPGFVIPLFAGIIVLAGFLLVPFFSMLAASFRGADGAPWGFSNFVRALTSPFYVRSFGNSLAVAAVSSAFGLAFGCLAAASINSLKPAAREGIVMLAGICSNFAGVPLAFGYIILLGANGMFSILMRESGIPFLSGFDLYTWAGLSLVYIYFQLPLAVLLLLPAFAGLKKEWEEAAYLLGAHPRGYWFRVAFPFLAPAVFGTGGILFANSLGAYATAYALTGSNYSLVPIRISALVASNVSLQPELGSAISVLLVAMMAAALGLNQVLQSWYRGRS